MSVYEVKMVRGIRSVSDAVEIKAKNIYEVPTKAVRLTGWKAFNIYKDGKLVMRFGY